MRYLCDHAAGLFPTRQEFPLDPFSEAHYTATTDGRSIIYNVAIESLMLLLINSSSTLARHEAIGFFELRPSK